MDFTQDRETCICHVTCVMLRCHLTSHDFGAHVSQSNWADHQVGIEENLEAQLMGIMKVSEQRNIKKGI